MTAWHCGRVTIGIVAATSSRSVGAVVMVGRGPSTIWTNVIPATSTNAATGTVRAGDSWAHRPRARSSDVEPARIKRQWYVSLDCARMPNDAPTAYRQIQFQVPAGATQLVLIRHG